MNRLSFAGAAALVAATALAGCNNHPEPTANETATAYPAGGNDMASMPYTLTPEQQQRRNSLNMTDYQGEYSNYMSQDHAANAGGSMANGSSGNNMMGNMSSGNSMNSSGSSNDMSFSSLDRNHDGKLSVAEYAVYAVGLDPTYKGNKNDQNPPYASADQLNRAADSFFYYDKNGDTYLDQNEFQAAKAGTTAGQAG